MAHLSHMPPFPTPPLRASAALPSAGAAPPHSLPPPRFLVPPSGGAAHSAAYNTLPPPPFGAPRSLSDTSTRITELSPCGGERVPHEAHLAMREAYIPILPRTASLAPYNKRCETCSAAHDGSFGAGRFCSSRCARTVGGLAHRKKRLMEREYKQKHAAQKRSKRLREVVAHEPIFAHSASAAPRVGPLPCLVAPSVHMAVGEALLAAGTGAPRASAPSSMTVSSDPSALCATSSSRQYRCPSSVMTISSLLNPSE